MLEEFLRRALDIEKKASSSYVNGISRIRGSGLKYSDVERVVTDIAVDTIIHRYLVEGITKAIKEVRDLKERYGFEKAEEIKPSKEQAYIVIRLAEQHLQIEKDMIALYRELAEKEEHPLLRKLMEEVSKNESEHHRRLSDLISKYSEYIK